MGGTPHSLCSIFPFGCVQSRPPIFEVPKNPIDISLDRGIDDFVVSIRLLS